jgi:hypothetical protein
MRFYTGQECEKWLEERARTKPDIALQVHSLRFDYPKEPHGIYDTASWIAQTLSYRQPTLLWITKWGIWPGSENWHLYYKLRQTYGDLRLLQETPGHLFLEYEAEDLASFIQVAMLNGWGAYILAHANYVNTFFSHDEYIEFFAGLEANLFDVRQHFAAVG